MIRTCSLDSVNDFVYIRKLHKPRKISRIFLSEEWRIKVGDDSCLTYCELKVMAESLALSDEKWEPQLNLKYKKDVFL